LSKLNDKIQKDDHNELVKRFSILEETRSEADRTLNFSSLDFHITQLTEKVTALQEQNEIFRVENEKIKQHYKELKNRKVHLDYLKHLKESVATLREIVEEARIERTLDRSLVSACLYTKHSQELLEYLVGTYPKDFRVNSCADASGSQPRSNTKKNRILLAKLVNKKKIEAQPRTNKSSLKTMNHEVIKFGDSYEAPKDVVTTASASDGTGKKKGRTVTLTTDDMQKRKNDVNARTTLLLALPDEHQLWFSKHKTAQELWAAILKTFDGNEATKKTKKNLLKQQYGNFKAEGSETLEQTFNRLHVIVSHLEFIDIEIEQDDLNQKFLTSLALEWLMHTIVWRNRSDLDTMSLDDLYNYLKMGHFARECMALRSQDKRKRDNYRQGSKVEEQTPKAFMAIDGVGWDWSYMANDEKNHALVFDEEAPTEFALMAKTSVESEVFDNSLCSKACKKNTDSLNSKITELTDKLSDSKNMIYHYKLGLSQVEARLAEHRNQEVKYCEKIRVLKFKAESRANYIKSLTKELELIKKEKEGLDSKLAGFQTDSKYLDSLLESQRLDKNKEGLGYSAIPPPPTQVYSHPKKDLSWIVLPEFADDTVTDYSRPSPTIESTSDDVQNRNSSVTKTETSPSTISSKPFVKKFPTGNTKFSTADMGYKGKAGSSQNHIDDKGYWESGCSRHMTCNISYLSDYEPFDGGYVSFGQGGCKITGKGTIKTGKLEFENVYFVKDLRTKDETNSILRKFITEIENLKDLKVKIIRRNRSLIEAARTMLADAKLPVTFWEEAVNTACYVQNRVLVNKVHNKTPYELFNGDEGYFLGYSMSSKAFRIFNKRNKRVEENVHIEFLENKAVEKGSGLNWLFDIDSLTKSMNYVPVMDAGQPQEPSSATRLISKRVTNQEEIPSLDNILTLTNQFEDILGDTSNLEESNGVEADVSYMETTIIASPTLTLRIHKNHPKSQIIGSVETPIQTRNKSKEVGEQSFIATIHQKTDPTLFQFCLFSCFLSQVEPKKISDALQDPSWVEAMQEELLQFKIQKVWSLVDCPKGVRPIRTKWVLKNKKDERGIVIRNKAMLVAQGHTQEEWIDYDEMDVKSTFLYGTIDKEVYVMQSPGFQDLEYPARVYKVEKAMYGLHQAPRAWYGTLSKYLLSNGFQRGTIDQTLFIRKQRGNFILVQVYVDDIIFGSSNPHLCREFEAFMHEKFQMSAMGELNFFFGLQVLQIEKGIFLSQDKYVGDILKKFGYSDVRSSNTPMDKENPWGKDGTGKDVDLHLYRSMIGSLMYLTASRPDIMFAVCACSRHQGTPKECHLHAVKRIFRYIKGHPKLGLWYPKDSPFDLVAYSDSDYGGATQDRKSTSGGYQFLGRRLISWQ
nr:hypothetical protein [Tanacetum cinerariifolium]